MKFIKVYRKNDYESYAIKRFVIKNNALTLIFHNGTTLFFDHNSWDRIEVLKYYYNKEKI